MKLTTAFRNLDAHGQYRAPEVIEEKRALLEKHLTRFEPDLVQLDASVTQSRGKKRIEAHLRLQLPSGVIVAKGDGFEVEPVLREAFRELEKRLKRHLARLRKDAKWKRPARRERLGALLPAVTDKAEADRRRLFFDLIEDHLDSVYNHVRRELTYLVGSGEVAAGRLSLRAMVDATILKGLDQFEQRPLNFSVGDWMRKLAHETIEQELRRARASIPEGVASLDDAPEAPAEEPTESDQEMFEFYQPDEVVRLEDLVAEDVSEAGAEDQVDERDVALALHRAVAKLPTKARHALLYLDIDDMPAEQVAETLGVSTTELTALADEARALLRKDLLKAGVAVDEATGDVVADVLGRSVRVPQPLDDKVRVTHAFKNTDPVAEPV